MGDVRVRPQEDNVDLLMAVWRHRRSGELVLWLRGQRPVRAAVADGGLVRPAQVVLLSQAVTRGRIRFEPGPARGDGRRRAVGRVLLAAARRLGGGDLPEGRLAVGVPPDELRELVGDPLVDRLLGRRVSADALLRDGSLARAELVALVRVGALVVAEGDASEEADTVGFRPVACDATWSVPPSVPPAPQVPSPRAQRRVTVRLGPAEDASVGPQQRAPQAAICFVAGVERGPTVLRAPGEPLPEVAAEAPTQEVAPAPTPVVEPDLPLFVAPEIEPLDDEPPLFVAPDFEAPDFEAPLFDEPTIDEPTTGEPTTDEPTFEPTLAPAAVERARRPAGPGLPRVPLIGPATAVIGLAPEVASVQEILIERARESLELGELPEAHDVLQRAFQLHPGNPRVLVHLAWTEVLLDPAAREVILQRVYSAVTHAPDDPVVHGFAAEISYVLRSA
ncbi:MAG: hypothetical protein H6742_09455 [Alphaproteobacteria bacterium]|nr:hypothetical protein [Alphaproteobacteria bacterium]